MERWYHAAAGMLRRQFPPPIVGLADPLAGCPSEVGHRRLRIGLGGGESKHLLGIRWTHGLVCLRPGGAILAKLLARHSP